MRHSAYVQVKSKVVSLSPKILSDSISENVKDPVLKGVRGMLNKCASY